MCSLVLVSFMSLFLDLVCVCSTQFPLLLTVDLYPQAYALLILPDAGYYFQAVLVLAEKGLILLTVEGRGQLTSTGQWHVHSIPCDTMTSILTGAVGMQWGQLWLGDWLCWVGGWLYHVWVLLVIHSPSPPPSPRSCASHCFAFHCIFVIVVLF